MIIKVNDNYLITVSMNYDKTTKENWVLKRMEGTGLGTLRLVVCLGHPYKDVIRQLETHMEFRMARGSEKDLTMSSLKIIRTIIESLFLYQEEKGGKEGRS